MPWKRRWRLAENRMITEKEIMAAKKVSKNNLATDKRIKALIFDLDGTLLDTLKDIQTAVNYALRANDLPERSREEVRSFVGNGARLLLERATAPVVAKKTIDQIEQDFKPYYDAHCQDKTCPYAGIPELLQQLRGRGLRLGVVSNKPDSAVQILVEQYFPETFFSITGEREGKAKKPAPDLLYEALANLRVEKEEALYIGDSEVDIQAAANAGIACISVAWGFKEKSFLQEEGARVIVSAPAEILAYL